MSVIPVTCIEDRCMRKGIMVFGEVKNCTECGGDLYPVNETVDDEPNAIYFEDGFVSGTAMENLWDNPNGFASPGYPYLHREFTKLSQVAQKPLNDTFQCPSDLSGCPIASKATVYIPWSMFQTWVFLAQEIDTEWIAYLTGEKVAEDKYEVEEMYFPAQRVTTTHCEAEEGEIKPNTIAAVHSHVGMKAFFSKEDVAHFNHQIELVVNRAGDLEANGRVKLECGRWHRGSANVIFTGVDEQVELQEALMKKMKPDTTQYEVKGKKNDASRVHSNSL